MITENYVSYEVAKLLKEKGFNTPLLTFYVTDKEKKEGDFQTMYFGDDAIDNNYSELCFIAPTQAMAMKWLREVHNWNIFINKSNTIYGYDANMESLVTNHIVEVGCEKTYEEACEAAIKYCLENLI